jgi:K+-sensing histidine kinase KdpD
MIFHKLRTPLAVMLNSLELLSRHAVKLGPEKTADASGRALQGARRLKAEVDDILQYLKSPNMAEPGHGFRVTELEMVIKRIARELGIGSVSIAGMDRLGDVRIRLSPQAVDAILWEVLENAKKFHPSQEPAIQIFGFHMKSQEVGIWIGDDGRTLSPEQLAQVWTPYYQAEKSFTGEVSGMGLGLPMVASLIWGVGGRCRLYNRPSEPGVIVELIVPVQEEESEPAASNSLQRTAG